MTTLVEELESKLRARQDARTEAAADTFTHGIGLLVAGHPETILAALKRAEPAADVAGLERWGFRWQGHDHGTHERMADGYWTPWHIAAAALTSLSEQLGERDAEIADLRESVIAFAGPSAAQYAKDWGLADDELHPVHYDLLQKVGARMDDFRRADLARQDQGK